MGMMTGMVDPRIGMTMGMNDPRIGMSQSPLQPEGPKHFVGTRISTSVGCILKIPKTHLVDGI